MMFYIQTADKLQRTARWLESLPGGLDYLKSVILEDSLGICDLLESQMQDLVGSNFDEWKEVVQSKEKRRMFKQFANTDQRIDTIEIIRERGQYRPSNWPKHNGRLDFSTQSWSRREWIKIVHLNALKYGSCCVLYGDTQLALYKIGERVYCTQQMCPHKRAFVLHDGILGDDGKGNYFITCPLHKCKFRLQDGQGLGMAIAVFEASISAEDQMIQVKLPPKQELDAVLGTELWKVKQGEERDQLDGIDIVGRKPKKNSCSLEW
jgi:nitrite reductase (NAD(P)H)